MLSNEAKAILNAQADYMKKNTGVQIIIEGHTDERGTREYNLALGNKRATVVKKYLVEQGVDMNSIEVISYGKERPVDMGSTKEAWSKNRRSVSIVM